MSIINILLGERLPITAFVTIIFVLGVGFGAVAVKTVDYSLREDLFNRFNSFMEEYEQLRYDRQSLVRDSIKFNLFNLLIFWLLGLSVFLAPLIALLVFFKGFVLGFTVGFLVSEYSLKGILIASAAVFPQNILIVPAYLLAAVGGFYFSLRLIKHYRGKERLGFHDFSSYTAGLALFGLILLGGALLETSISPFLFGFVLHYF